MKKQYNNASTTKKRPSPEMAETLGKLLTGLTAAEFSCFLKNTLKVES